MIKLILALAFLLALIVLYPLALIWALNTLFALGIAFTLKTWAATLLLAGVFSGASYKVASK